LVQETEESSCDGNPCFVLVATPEAELENVADFRGAIALLHNAPPVVLELAATYDAFREQDADHEEALQRLRRKKGRKCNEGNEEQALALLGALGLPCG